MSTHNGPTLIAGLRFSLLLGWKHRLPAGGPTVFWLAALLSVCTDIALNWFLIDSTDGPYPEGLSDSTQWILLSLLLSWLLAWQLLRWVSESECLVDSQNPLNTLSPHPGPDPAGCWAGRRGRPDQGGTG